ncbi:hypothetical protein ACWPKO_13260 [Coraliomargarita sp. W4R53]
MKNTPIFIALSALIVGTAAAQQFTGASGVDTNFSTPANWDSGLVPTSGTITVSANDTSLGVPAVVDASLGIVGYGIAKIYSEGAGGTGMAYAAVASGGTLSSSVIYVGNADNQYFDGNLTVRSGGSIRTEATNAGHFRVGGQDVGEVGTLLIEDGASIEHSKLTLNTYGSMTFEFGASSVSTFYTVSSKDGITNLLDGLVQVDLAALTTAGSYTLISSDHASLLLSGQLITDLATAGGTISSSTQSSSFNVLNAGTSNWTLSTANGGQDLLLNVTSIPEASSYALLLGGASVALIGGRRIRL